MDGEKRSEICSELDFFKAYRCTGICFQLKVVLLDPLESEFEVFSFSSCCTGHRQSTLFFFFTTEVQSVTIRPVCPYDLGVCLYFQHMKIEGTFFNQI